MYGFSGSGKSGLKTLESRLSSEDFLFFEGSNEIAEVAGDPDVFKNASARDQADLRAKAIRGIVSKCTDAREIGLVAGHATI